MPVLRSRRRRGRLNAEPLESARAASLRYVSDAVPGVRRVRSGRGFAYRSPDGTTIRDRATVARIRALVIPPAWTDVWICPNPNGHLQATGRDARGRKQYRYHARWRRVRDETKYERMLLFGGVLPRIRARLRDDLARPGLPREKVLATVVRLLETTFIRVGNEEYARQNNSFGLTTLKSRHVAVQGSRLEFRFPGKSGKNHAIRLSDRRLARLVRRCRELPGQDLFQYLDESGAPQPIDSGDVNDYLRAIAGDEFTTKDFRTWAGTLLAAQALTAPDDPALPTPKARAVRATKSVADRLGNTPAVCRKCYIHPAVFQAFEDPAMRERWEAARAEAKGIDGLEKEEAALLRFLTGVNGGQ